MELTKVILRSPYTPYSIYLIKGTLRLQDVARVTRSLGLGLRSMFQGLALRG